MNLKIVLPLAVLVAAAIGAVTMILLKPEVETRRPGIRPPIVRVATVHIVDVPLVVESQGTVGPRTQINACFYFFKYFFKIFIDCFYHCKLNKDLKLYKHSVEMLTTIITASGTIVTLSYIQNIIKCAR